jgi:hypothetical protein
MFGSNQLFPSALVPHGVAGVVSVQCLQHEIPITLLYRCVIEPDVAHRDFRM